MMKSKEQVFRDNLIEFLSRYGIKEVNLSNGGSIEFRCDVFSTEFTEDELIGN